jgi:hypothetical protein
MTDQPPSKGISSLDAPPINVELYLKSKVNQMEKLQELMLNENEDLNRKLKVMRTVVRDLEAQIISLGATPIVDVPEFGRMVTRSPTNQDYKSKGDEKNKTSGLLRGFTAKDVRTATTNVEYGSGDEDDDGKKESLANKLKSGIKSITRSRKSSAPIIPADIKSVWVPMNEQSVKGTIWEDVWNTVPPKPSPKEIADAKEWIIQHGHLDNLNDWVSNPEFEVKAKFVYDPRVIVGTVGFIKKNNMTADKLVEAFVSGDEKVMTIDNLNHLKKILPSDDVMKKLSEYNGLIGELYTVDRFFKGISAVPGYFQRIDLWILKQSVESELKSFVDQIQYIESALDFLKKSVEVKQVLGAMLHVSNLIHKENAPGFVLSQTVEALKKSIDNRMLEIDPSKNILYCTLMYLSKFHPDAVSFPSKIQPLRSAAAIIQEEFRDRLKRFISLVELIPPYCANNEDESKDPIKKSLKLIYFEKIPVLFTIRKQADEAVMEAIRVSSFFGDVNFNWESLFQSFILLAELFGEVYRDPSSSIHQHESSRSQRLSESRSTSRKSSLR